MAYKHLATYLNDHLAGSVIALKLLAHLENIYAGTTMASSVVALRADIEADRQELEQLMARMEITQRVSRQATVWMAEKMTQLKLHLDDPTDGALRQLEMLEGLALGIQGKQALWRGLAATTVIVPSLQGINYEQLEQRAEEQHQQVERLRLEAAKIALAIES